MPAWLDKATASVKSTLGLQNEEEEQGTQGLLSQLDEATTLSRTQRLVGFAACTGLGLLLTFLSPMFLLRPTKFAAIYSMGSLVSLGGSMFLVGPWKQIKNMFDSKRVIASIIYLVSIVLTLLAAFKLHSIILCLVFIVAQFCAFIWYCTSYIPFAQAFILRLFGREAGDTGGW